jgi:hypothetical protein
MLVAENLWQKMYLVFPYFFYQLRNYDGQKMQQARSWRSFNFRHTSEGRKKRLSIMWRREPFEREQVSPGMGFYGRGSRITFVSVANRNSSNCLPSSSLARRSKRKAVQDLNPEDGQQNNLNTKRRKLEDNVSYNYTP